MSVLNFFALEQILIGEKGAMTCSKEIVSFYSKLFRSNNEVDFGKKVCFINS